MIRCVISTYKVVGGGLLHRGRCEVSHETLSAGAVASSAIPDGPAKGFGRVTLSWVCSPLVQDGTISQYPTYRSSCSFEILDRVNE